MGYKIGLQIEYFVQSVPNTRLLQYRYLLLNRYLDVGPL